MTKKNILVVTEYSTNPLTLDEVCEICRTDAQFIQHLIELGVLKYTENEAHSLLFHLQDLRRIKTVLRLQRDLEVNLAGAALALDLLDEIEQLRKQLTIVEKHYLYKK